MNNDNKMTKSVNDFPSIKRFHMSLYFIITLALMLFASGLVLSQDVLSSKENSSNWFTNIKEAKLYAEANDGDILMVFAGSDWCRPCIQFKSSILDSDGFKNNIMDKQAVLYLDFPARKKNKLSDEATAHNENLAERYNRSGAFPKIIVIDPKENILGDISFQNQSVEEFVASYTKLIQ